MVKYSNRGLVKSGKVSSLFHQLYYTLVTTFLVMTFVVGFSGFLKGEEKAIAEQILAKVCLRQMPKEDELTTNSSKTYIVGITLNSINTLILIMTFAAAKIFVWKNSKNKETPVKYGKYRRNIFTYSQTMVIGASHFISYTITLILSNTAQGQNFGLIRNLIIWNCILYFVILGIFIPIYVLDLFRRVPEFYIKPKPTKNLTFFTTNQTITPRKQPTFDDFAKIEDRRKFHSGNKINETKLETGPKMIKVKPYNPCKNLADKSHDRKFCYGTTNKVFHINVDGNKNDMCSISIE